MAARYNTVGDYSNLHHTYSYTSDRKFTFPSDIYLPSVKNYVLAKEDEAYNFLLDTASPTRYSPVQYRDDRYEKIPASSLPYMDKNIPIEKVALALQGSQIAPPATEGFEYTPSYGKMLGSGDGKTKASCSVSKDGAKAKCSCSNAMGEDAPLDKVFSPEFNMREIGKQMILLEDHLFNPYRRCTDCITKHSLMIEALIEEALTLDVDQAYIQSMQQLLDAYRAISRDLLRKVKASSLDQGYANDCAQRIRKLRKPICKEFCDFY
jgi:hypothetical protein